jgi:hypothetical protein
VVDALELIYRRGEAIEPLVRSTFATPPIAPRPNRSQREAVLHDALREVTERADPAAAARLERMALLLTSPLVHLYWKDYCGLRVEETAAIAGWALAVLVEHLRGNTRVEE